MSIIRGARPADNFAMIHNTALADKSLSYKARGLLSYMLSRPPGWTTSAERLAAESPKEGRDAVLSGLKELEEAGYLHRVRKNNEQGKWVYDQYVTDRPTMAKNDTITGLADDGSAGVGSTDSGSAGHISKTDSNKTESNKSEVVSTPPATNDVQNLHPDYTRSITKVKEIFKGQVAWHPDPDDWAKAVTLYPEADPGRVVIEYIMKNRGKGAPNVEKWLSWVAQAHKQATTSRMEIEAKLEAASKPKPKEWWHTAADD